MWIAEVDRYAGRDGEFDVSGHLTALVPGDGSHELGGQCGDGLFHRCFDGEGSVVFGQMQEQNEPCRTFHERSDSTCAPGTDNEVTLPVTRDRSIGDFARTVSDHHHVGNLAASLRRALCSTCRPSGPQEAGQLS